MIESKTVTTQKLTEADIFAKLQDSFGKPIPEEYRYSSTGGEPINLLDRSLKAQVGVLRCCPVDDSAIRAYGITEEELKKYSVAGHWSKTFSRILSERKKAYHSRQNSQ
ncbi:MAG: hypothetical protein FWH05_06855 [Oscillospiraceae bacterium]|nr:hypothetical protein [Oscillospiraceae bacterium]